MSKKYNVTSWIKSLPEGASELYFQLKEEIISFRIEFFFKKKAL
jgi:hypothetical protein